MEKTIENMDRNRLGILIRCLVILLITGVTNSAAVFVSPLAAHFNWTADAIANVSTTMLLCWTPGALIGGTLMSKIGARNAMLLGAVLFPLGTLTSSFVPQSSPWLLYVTFSFLQGLGNGLAYTVATYVSTGWYPDKRGLVSGLCMAFTGGSSAFLAPICSKLVQSTGIISTLRIVGLVSLVVCVVCAQGYTTVINGVAILNDNQDGSKIKKDYFIHDERQSMSGSKEAIGLEACKLIEPNDIVLIDTGSTTECMLKHLNLDFPITVVGYTLNTMVACQNRSNISLICGGGFYHRNTELFDSPEGVALISRLNINKCFMAAAGVTSKGNLSCIEPYEFMYKKAAINSSSTRILLVDSSKFGKMRPCMFSNLSDFDIVITDGDIGGNWIRLFEQSNLKYIIV